MTITRRGALRLALSSVTTAAALPAFAGGHGRVATFQSAGSYRVGGRVEIADGRVNILSDFSFQGAPDPKIALGRNGYDSGTLMGLLRSNDGASSYAIPAGIDPSDYNEVWIWCERYNVPLAVARF